jgi:hypothetical protein
MVARKRFTVNAIGATDVTLNPMTTFEDPKQAGSPNIFGTGTIVITQGATPDATFWRAARAYLITIAIVDG